MNKKTRKERLEQFDEILAIYRKSIQQEGDTLCDQNKVIKYTMIPNCIMLDSELTYGTRIFYWYLKSRCYYGKSFCYPSIETIAQDLKMHVSTINEAKNALVNRGLLEIKKIRHEGGWNTYNQYVLVDLEKVYGEKLYEGFDVFEEVRNILRKENRLDTENPNRVDTENPNRPDTENPDLISTRKERVQEREGLIPKKSGITNSLNLNCKGEETKEELNTSLMKFKGQEEEVGEKKPLNPLLAVMGVYGKQAEKEKSDYRLELIEEEKRKKKAKKEEAREIRKEAKRQLEEESKGQPTPKRESPVTLQIFNAYRQSMEKNGFPVLKQPSPLDLKYCKAIEQKIGAVDKTQKLLEWVVDNWRTLKVKYPSIRAEIPEIGFISSEWLKTFIKDSFVSTAPAAEVGQLSDQQRLLDKMNKWARGEGKK